MEKRASKCGYYIDVILLISAMTCHANGLLIFDLFLSHVTMETMVTRGDIGTWKARAKNLGLRKQCSMCRSM